MPVALAIAMALNIVVLIPVTFGMITDTPWAGDAYGADSPARGILLSIYLAIIAASVIVFFAPSPGHAAATLMLVQIIYKSLTIYFVGLGNPVVVSNALIVLFHTAMLSITFR